MTTTEILQNLTTIPDSGFYKGTGQDPNVVYFQRPGIRYQIVWDSAGAREFELGGVCWWCLSEMRKVWDVKSPTFPSHAEWDALEAFYGEVTFEDVTAEKVLTAYREWLQAKEKGA